jgi:hypothetical protein
LNAVVDRMVGIVAPKVTARAASVCQENTCY